MRIKNALPAAAALKTELMREQESKKWGRERDRERDRELLKQPPYTIQGRSAACLAWLLMILFVDELVPSESVHQEQPI